MYIGENILSEKFVFNEKLSSDNGYFIQHIWMAIFIEHISFEKFSPKSGTC
jgi:hypothetical protein